MPCQSKSHQSLKKISEKNKDEIRLEEKEMTSKKIKEASGGLYQLTDEP